MRARGAAGEGTFAPLALAASLALIATSPARPAFAELPHVAPPQAALPPGGCGELGAPAVTAFVEAGRTRLAIVPETSPLLAVALLPDAIVELEPIRDAETLAEAAERWAAGALACEGARAIAARDLRSPVDGARLDAPIRLPTLAVAPGVMDPGGETEARIARVYDLATIKSPDDARMPVYTSAASVVGVEGGEALAIALESPVAGLSAVLHGPIVRLRRASPGRVASSTASETRSTHPGAESVGPGSPDRAPLSTGLAGRAAEVRERLDRREHTLAIGDRVRAQIDGFGVIDRPVEAALASPPRPGDPLPRALVAHGLAIGLPLLSIGLSVLNTRPSCVTFCSEDDLFLPGDRAFVGSIRGRSAGSLADASRALSALEGIAIGAAVASAMVPSGRRGVFGRLELLEDALIIGEAALLGLTTPLWLEARIGRARPVAFRAGEERELEGRGRVGPPFVARATATAASAASSAVTLLVVEEAGAGWIVSTSAALGTIVGAVAYLDVRSGTSFPTDVPVAILSGLTAGAGMALWHSIFWRGWPGGDTRGDLPLRITGLDVGASSEGAAAGLRGSF